MDLKITVGRCIVKNPTQAGYAESSRIEDYFLGPNGMWSEPEQTPEKSTDSEIRITSFWFQQEGRKLFVSKTGTAILPAGEEDHKMSLSQTEYLCRDRKCNPLKTTCAVESDSRPLESPAGLILRGSAKVKRNFAKRELRTLFAQSYLDAIAGHEEALQVMLRDAKTKYPELIAEMKVENDLKFVEKSCPKTKKKPRQREKTDILVGGLFGNKIDLRFKFAVGKWSNYLPYSAGHFYGDPEDFDITSATVAFDGKNLGKVGFKIPVYFDGTNGYALPYTAISGLKNLPRNRGVLITTNGAYADPQRWKPILPDEKMKSRAFRGLKRIFKTSYACTSDGEFNNWNENNTAIKERDFAVTKAYGSVDGQFLFGLKMWQECPNRADTHPERNPPDATHWFYAKGNGEPKFVVSAMLPFEAADLDMDGKSEWIFSSEWTSRGYGALALFSSELTPLVKSGD